MLGLRTVIYTVNDIIKAKEWYAKAFGTAPYFDQPFYVGFNIGGYELGLQPEEQNNTQKGENIITYWGVEAIEESYQQLIHHGASPHTAPTDVGEGIFVASVKDPWDNIIGIIYNPHFK